MASELLNAGGSMSLTVRMAAGDYLGDMDGGLYELPLFDNQ